MKQILSSEKMQLQFAAALPKHLSAERFARISITALSRTPKLAECTPASFFKCLLDLSAMGLEPDGRHAHLIPYKTECTVVVDYKGLVDLVRRSGDVAKIHADVVCENDVFLHSMGEVTQHTFDLRKPRGKVYAAYAQVTLKDGSVQAEVMSKDDIEKIRKKSKAANGGPWKDHWDEMAKKTAFRRLTKWLKLSPEVNDHMATANEHEFIPLRNVTPREDMVPRLEPADPFRQPAPAPAAPAAPAATTAAPIPEEPPEVGDRDRAQIKGHKSKEGKGQSGKPWKLHIITLLVDGDEIEVTTFSDTDGGLAEFNVGQWALVEIVDGAKGKDLASIEIVDEGGAE